MSSKPSVYSLSRGESISLYLGEFSSVAGLQLLPPEAGIKVSEFGAYSAGGTRWLAANDLPKLDTVSGLVGFLISHDSLESLDLIDLVVHINGIGKLATHDNGECSFTGLAENTATSIVAAAAGEPPLGPVWRALVAHPGFFIVTPTSQPWLFYSSFEDWVAKKQLWHAIVEHHLLSDGSGVLIVEPEGPSLATGIDHPVELKRPYTSAVEATASREFLLRSATDGIELPAWRCLGPAGSDFPPGSLIRFGDNPRAKEK